MGGRIRVHDNIEDEIYVMYLTCQVAASLKFRCHQGQLCTMSWKKRGDEESGKKRSELTSPLCQRHFM